MSKIVVTGGLGFIGSHTVVGLQNLAFELKNGFNTGRSNDEYMKMGTKNSG